jgi:hypothetical protein
LVEALRYKPKGNGFDSRRYHLGFYLLNPSGRAVAPAVDSVSNRNEYQEYFLGVQTAGADCLGVSASWNYQGLSRPAQGFILYVYLID